MEKRTMNRRDFLRLTAAVATGAVMAACAPATPQIVEVEKEVPVEKVVKETVVVEKEVVVEKPAKPPEKVKLRWWSYYAPSNRCLMCAGIAKEYEDEHPDVTIELAHGMSAYQEKLATAFAAGDPPELYGTTHTTWLLQVKDGAVLELEDWYHESGMMEKVHPGAKAWCTVKGKLYGVSAWDVFCQEWYYNRAVFEELGLSEPKTEDELYEAADSLKGKVRYPLMFGGGSPGAFTWNLLSPIQAQTVGITPILEGTEAKDYHIPGLLKAVEKVNRMFKEELLSLDDLGTTATDVITAFAQGEVAIIPFHTGWYPSIRESVRETGEKVKLDLFKDAVLFVEDPKSPWAAGFAMIWAVPKVNKHLDETLDFLTYVMSPEVQRRIAAAGLGIPPLPETWDAITEPLLKVTIKHLGEATEEALYLVDFLHPRVVEAIDVSMRAMATGEGTPEGVLDAMTEAIRTV